MRNADAQAAAIMLSGMSAPEKEQALSRLASDVSHQAGSQCPECGSLEVEDNQAHGDDFEYHCGACDHRWQPE